ncbi:MAG: putative RNA pseudouridine synthase [Candidatus Hydrogenedentota bacterium]
MRLQKYLASCGIASRRQAEQLIESGRVLVNGKPVLLGHVITPGEDAITLDGKAVQPENKVYILLNKPRGVITSVKDTHERKTVVDCLEGLNERLFPVGRLDMDVEGALLLTNDGELAYRMTHPRFQIDKIYLAWVEGSMSTETAIRLEHGVELDDGMTAPAEVVILYHGKKTTLIQLLLREGRKREVKRMCKHVGHPVRELQRVSVGNVKVKGLKPGEWRYLSASEVDGLYKLVGLRYHHA